MVPIAEKEGMPFVLPSRESMTDQTYPFRQAIYLYFDKSPNSALPDAVQEFLAFVRTRDGEETLIKAGWFPLPPTEAQSKVVALRVPIE
jgi:phosphate transport system substrate-binding protein